MATPDQRLVTEAALTENLGPDTGARDISSLCTGLTSGTVLFQSKNGWNILAFGNAVFTYEGGDHAFMNSAAGLAGWAPLPHMGAKGYVSSGPSAGFFRAQMSSTGAATIYGTVSGMPLNGQIVWPMNRPAPTTWPGAAIT